jgi:hemerythrin
MNKKLSTFFLGVILLVMITAIILGFMVDFFNPVSWGLILLLILIPFIHKKMVAQNFVEWRDEYSVGIASIDEQHKRLLNLINQLQTAAHYHTEEAFVDRALDELVDYTKTHFGYEEGLMEQNGYPDLEAHKGEHQAMIKQVGESIERYKSDPDQTIEDIVQYLKKWLINHINGTDKGYSGFLVGKGVK